jgi:hypothetical protein
MLNKYRLAIALVASVTALCERGGARTDAEVQIGVAQQIQHHQPDEQDDQNADENGKEAGGQRQVMERADVPWRCSKFWLTP